VTLYPAATASELDFKMLDRRDMAPVGYQRINKRSGEPVPGDDIVKGYEYEDDQYVVLSSEEFRAANVEATQTVDIFAFVHADEIPPYHFETPYYLEPSKRGAKGYALLREVLRRKQRIALANVVIRTRQHLAALVPVGRMLVLDTLRFADEIRAFDTATLPGDDLAALKVSERELAMAERLVDDMEEPWRPAQYRDTYRDDLLALIHRKVEAGETRVLTEPHEGRGRDGRRGRRPDGLAQAQPRSARPRRARDAVAHAAAQGGRPPWRTQALIANSVDAAVESRHADRLPAQARLFRDARAKRRGGRAPRRHAGIHGSATRGAAPALRFPP
jgi:DNA end-binding protein Ku